MQKKNIKWYLQKNVNQKVLVVTTLGFYAHSYPSLHYFLEIIKFN